MLFEQVANAQDGRLTQDILLGSSIPPKGHIDCEPYRLSSIEGSDQLNHCRMKWMRSMRSNGTLVGVTARNAFQLSFLACAARVHRS